MKLAEIFSQLTHGELSQIAIGGNASGEINDANYDAVLTHINLGLTALFRRFPLKQGRFTVALQQGRFTYPLTKQYAASNTRSTEPVKYILDTEENFVDDILKVEAVYTEGGWELGLNDEADIHAISTPSSTVLRVPPLIVAKDINLPSYLQTSTLEVVYRANHPIISQTGSFNPETYEVQLPYSYLEALLFFIASRVHNPIGMVNEFNAGNNYAAKYEMACQQLETFNLRVDQGSAYDRLRSNGWV